MLTKYCYDLDAASSQFKGEGQSFSFEGHCPPLPLAGYGPESNTENMYTVTVRLAQ